MENFFHLFNLPVTLNPDPREVRSRYLQLSKSLHPDYHVGMDEVAQAEALEASAHLNKAYKTLTNKDSLLAYVLELKGLIGSEEKQHPLPGEFLMEMLEINDRLEEAEGEEKETIYRELEQMENDLFKEVQSIYNTYDDNKIDKASLEKLLNFHLKKRYLQRLRKEQPGREQHR